MAKKVALLKFDNSRDKWIAEFNGKMLCQSKDRFRVIRQITDGECPKAVGMGVSEIAENPSDDMSANYAVTGNTIVSLSTKLKNTVPDIMEPHFTVAERFKFLENNVNDVIDGEAQALIVIGNPGMGKSQTVTDQFTNRGMTNILTLMVNNTEGTENMNGGDGDYIIIKGYSTAKAMYRKLYQNRNRIIVFDDCDKVLEDKTAISILKSALDSYAQRIITWGAENPLGTSDPEDPNYLPSHFEFKGGVIFITNKPRESLDDAVKTRCARSNVWMTTDEVIERIEQKMDDVVQVKDVARSYRRDAIAFLRSNKHLCPDMNFRTFIQVARNRKNYPDTWERMALANLVA